MHTRTRRSLVTQVLPIAALAAITWMVLSLLRGAPAYAEAGPPYSDGDLVSIILQGVLGGGSYFAAAAGALVLLTAILRRGGSQLLPWLGTDVGGTTLAFGGSVGGALLTAALAHVTPSWGLIWASIQVGATAVGGYVALKRLVIAPLRSRAASWPWPLRALYSMVAWIFDRQAPPPPAATSVLLVLMVSLGGCATARHVTAVGVSTALDCQTATLTGLAGEAFELAKNFMISTIADDGTVDTGAIREAARAVRSDAGRCAFAAAMAAIADVASQRRGALSIGPSPSTLLRETMASIGRFDWSRPVTLDGVSVAP